MMTIQKTVLFDNHVKLGGKMVDFAGWHMPLHYGSQINEHLKVREEAGIFDVSHMAVTDISGIDAKKYLQFLLANDVEKLKPGKALYSCMLNPKGGIIDDLIVYQIAEDYFRLVTNAGTREKVAHWLMQQKNQFQVKIEPRQDKAIIAIQGPQAIAKVQQILTAHQEAIAALKPFEFIYQQEWLIARTGYTGEDGLEIILPLEEAAHFWQTLVQSGIQPCGLGARDTLRLEAGLNLYGSDMDEKFTPLESNLAWTVTWEPETRRFIGRDALEQQKQQGITQQLVGIVMDERAILRAHQPVIFAEDGKGEITSGSFSPTLQCSIAFARVPMIKSVHATVLIRGKEWPVKIVKPPFVKKGKKAC